MQRATLGRLLRRAAQTRFGRDHGFAEIRSISDYQAQVPLRRYEDFWRDYWRADFPELHDITWPGRIPAFALSSGTTGATTKRIPVSRAMLRANEGAAFDTLASTWSAGRIRAWSAGAISMLGGSTVARAPGAGRRRRRPQRHRRGQDAGLGAATRLPPAPTSR